MKKNYKFYVKMFLIVIAALYFGGRIIYSAIPYHGSLSWKIDELFRKRKIEFVHDNFFKDGAEGLLLDLREKFSMPEDLYITNQFEMSFDETGEIQKIETFLYGKNEKGKNKTYLIDYDRSKSEKITVWLDGNANTDYNSDMRFSPMLKILEKADCEQRVESWTEAYPDERYEIVYYGRRSFTGAEGLVCLPGDVDGDGQQSGVPDLSRLYSGGAVLGFEVSLHMPEQTNITPVRYMMEPEYISQKMLNQEHEEEQTTEAKEANGWTVDQNNGTVYFFLNDKAGWRLIVTDAAAGSRFYELEQTTDGGTTWKNVHRDPFGGETGVVEGLVFFDENFGVAGLTGASQSHSALYVTRDGGMTFSILQLPVDTVTELPTLAKECNFTLEDYQYYDMPDKDGDTFTIRLMTGAGENEGIVFKSTDNGETWVYVSGEF